MKSWVLNFLAVVIMLFSLSVDLHSEISFQNGQDAISALPNLDVTPLRNPTSKNSLEITFSSQQSFESARIAESSSTKQTSFLYYLPIYSLVREKEYFLLI